MPSAKALLGLLWHLFLCPELVLGRHRHAPPPVEYIFVSQPARHSVAVTEINALTRKVIRGSRPLISSGLREPSGLAVDQEKQRLYVADPKSHKVFMYKLYLNGGGLHVNKGEQFVVVRDVTPRWVTVDEKGTLLCTDEGRNLIAEVSAAGLAKLGEKDLDGNYVHPNFLKLYDHTQTKQVDRPGGIAAEGNHVFWGNRVQGRPFGSLLSAPEDPEFEMEHGMPRNIHALSSNVDKVYGVCATPSLVFYTGGRRSVYGAKPGSHDSQASKTVFLSDYAMPRGCAWDGDNTVFLADSGSDTVWSFSSSDHSIGLTQAAKSFKVKDPFGVAVLRPVAGLGTFDFLQGGALRAQSVLPALLMAVLWGFNA